MRCIDLPEIPGNGPHAVQHGPLLYTTAITAAANGTVTIGQECEQVCNNAKKILRAAGLNWRDVVRCNVFVAPDAGVDEPWRLLWSYLPASTVAGMCVGFAPVRAYTRVALELIAAQEGLKQVLPVPQEVGGERTWAAAVRVEDLIFVSGVRSNGGPSNDGGGESEEPGPSTTDFEITKSAYVRLDGVVAAMRNVWPDCRGWPDIVRVHQYMSYKEFDLSQFREARANFLRIEEFISTSVVCPSGNGTSVGRSNRVDLDAELALGDRSRTSVPEVWVNPGGLHAVAGGGLLFVQAQMSRTPDATTRHIGDAQGQANLIHENLEKVLVAAGGSWRNVLHIRTFGHNVDAAAAAVESRRRFMGSHRCAETDLIAAFFDRDALVEVEITAAI